MDSCSTIPPRRATGTSPPSPATGDPELEHPGLTGPGGGGAKLRRPRGRHAARDSLRLDLPGVPRLERDIQAGPDLYADSVIALNATNGDMLWFYQTTPHDLYDFDCGWNTVLGSVTQGGSTQEAVFKACKNGYLYAINALTGKLLWYFDPPTVSRLGTGNANYVVTGNYSATLPWINYPSTQEFEQCPGENGAVESDIAYAYSLIYVATMNFCSFGKVAPVGTRGGGGTGGSGTSPLTTRRPTPPSTPSTPPTARWPGATTWPRSPTGAGSRRAMGCFSQGPSTAASTSSTPPRGSRSTTSTSGLRSTRARRWARASTGRSTSTSSPGTRRTAPWAGGRRGTSSPSPSRPLLLPRGRATSPRSP